MDSEEANDSILKVLVTSSHPFLRQEQVSEARISFEALRSCSQIIWTLCEKLGLQLTCYTLAMKYLQTTLVLCPDLRARLKDATLGRESIQDAPISSRTSETSETSKTQTTQTTQNNQDTQSTTTKSNSDTTNDAVQLPNKLPEERNISHKASKDAKSSVYTLLAAGCLAASSLTEGIPKKIGKILTVIDQFCLLEPVTSEQIAEVQREALESASFDFQYEHVPVWVLKFAHYLRIKNEDLVYNAWLISADAYETSAVLCYSTPAIALASLRLALLHAYCEANMPPQAPYTWYTTRNLPLLANVSAGRMHLNRCEESRCMVTLANFYIMCHAKKVQTRGSVHTQGLNLSVLIRKELRKQRLPQLKTQKVAAQNRSRVSKEGFARYQFTKQS